MTINEVIKCDNFIISISKFLNHYYYINSNNLNKLSHEVFMEIFNLRGISTGSIKLEEVLSGEIILVSDVYDRVFGYRNPLIINKNEENESFFITNVNIGIDNDYDDIDLNNINLGNLSDYELDRLLTMSKKLKDERIKNKIIKELKFRPDSKPGVKSSLLEKVRKREFNRNKE